MFNMENFLPSLLVMAKGMAGIFVVMGLIYLLTVLTNKAFAAKKDKKD